MRMLLAIALLGGCLRSTEYKCTSNDQCGASGVCEASVGFCSFPDPQCGRRFGDSAGALAGACVGGNLLDGGVDGQVVHDGPGTDARPVDGGDTCPGYAAIGGSAHRYKLVASDAWNNQRSACSGSAPLTYLAIPDDAGEVTALDSLAGSGLYWVGISESGGTFPTVKGGNQTFFQWAPGQPNSTGNSHCVEITASGSSAGQFDLGRCSDARPAICECEP